MTAITLLDGGMGQELIARAGGVATALWSTQALLDAPEIVADVHRDYAAAGASVATTNSYALHRDRLRGGDSNHYAKEGLALPNIEHQFEDLIASAVAAAGVVKPKSRIAGSIGPIGASYRADLLPPHDEAVRLFAEVATLLAPGVDILLFETIPGVGAGRAALEAGRKTDRPVWLSFTVDDQDGRQLRSGEPLADAVQMAAGADAVLINCSMPEAIPAALAELKGLDIPFGAYANGFTKILEAFIKGEATVTDALKARTDLGPEAYAKHALSWVEQGASIVGGCCEVGPAHIKELRGQLIAAGHTIV
jgi:S-methylmethionine-dependent homocysteine/selenocysteine methylase